MSGMFSKEEVEKILEKARKENESESTTVPQAEVSKASEGK